MGRLVTGCRWGPAVAHAAWSRLVPTWLAERAGGWEYRFRKAWRDHWGARPFNGQEARQQMLREICERVPFVAVVETGTFRGATAAHLHRVTGLPVHSFEANARHYGFARARLRGLTAVHLHHGDSRAGLERLASTAALQPGPVLFYLDAHGLADLPLAAELEIAFRHWGEAVVIVDDFAVPDDPGYNFDDYGAGRALTLAYLDENGLRPEGVWLPRCASAAETGERRGCVVLARAPEVIRRIDGVAAVRRWSDAGAGRASGPAPSPGCPDARPPTAARESSSAAR